MIHNMLTVLTLIVAAVSNLLKMGASVFVR